MPPRDTPPIPNGEMNVTPMLDVLLVLLVIFMAVSIQVYRTLDGALPQRCVGVCADSSAVVLNVGLGPTYAINGERVPPSQLAGRLSEIYRGRPGKRLGITADTGTTYDAVYHAMDVASGAGVRVINILIPPDSEPRR